MNVLDRVGMRMRGSLLVLIVASTIHAQAQLSHPILGVWKLKTPPAARPGIQGRLFEFSAGPDGRMLLTMNFINEKGRPLFTQAVFKLDGQPWPIYQTEDLAEFLSSGKQSSQRAVFRAESARTISLTNGATTRTFTVAEDGKTMTETTPDFVAIYERVP